MEVKNLGGGVVLFKEAFSIDQNDVVSYLEQQKEKWREENFTIINDDSGRPIHAVNKGGFIYELEDVAAAPVRVQNLDHPFFKMCDETIYLCLLEYIEIFPAILQSLWWRSTGHALCYDKGAGLGLHCDNDVNYRFGAAPREQHATRNVVSALAYINDSTDDDSVPYSFSGGHMKIPYFDIDVMPSKGDVLLMPASYIGAHEILPVTRGTRYSYLCWFAQGSEDEEKGIVPQVPDIYYKNSGQWWLNTIIEDYDSHLSRKYSDTGIPENLIAFRERKDDHRN
jgi:hypothetical protein